jgi:regulator of nonsense transcripts 1
MAGDLKTLLPQVSSESCIHAGFQSSLFERLIKQGKYFFQLPEQFRMHPSLSRFPSNHFYEGEMVNGISVTSRELSKFPWPNKDMPLLFYHSSSMEESNQN